MVFSTLTFSGSAPAPGWWYYSLESGQHVSFYQPRTLHQIAVRLGCEYTRIHEGLHLFMAAPLAPALRRVLRSRRLRSWAEAWYWAHRRRPSLTWAQQRLQAGANAAR